MRNPLLALKLILQELRDNGRLLMQQASMLSDRLATIEQRLIGIEQGLTASTDRLVAIEQRLAGIEQGLLNPPVEDNRMFFGLDELDRKLKSYLDQQNGFFVELGANDGVEQSNTLHFDKFCGWTGVLVEPTPHNFLKCRANRSSLSHIFCCACVAFDYPEKFANLPFRT